MKRMMFTMLALSLLCVSCKTVASWKVSIAENPTTGYTLDWRQEGKGSVALESDDFQVSSNLLGAGGTHSYVFKGVSPGDVDVTFTYSRKWETDGDKQTYLYHLKVDRDLSVTER